jgi:hypothetical protein
MRWLNFIARSDPHHMASSTTASPGTNSP